MAKMNPTLVVVPVPPRPNYVGKFKRLDDYICSSPSGTIFFSETLAKQFLMSSAKTIGGLLRQREDVEKIKCGTWMKL